MCNAIGNFFRLIIIAATAGALTLSVFASVSCELVEYNDSGGLTYGFFFRGIDGNCASEYYETDDPVINGARTVLIISMGAGFIAGVMVLFEWLFCEICCAGVLEGLAFMAAWMLGAASFMFYGSERCTQEGAECTFYDASGYMTGACILYVGCNILLCFTPQPEPLCSKK
ncbi:expressed unknown protein [Seminavis robusta]|uniref:Uncharacterized protein n=1 Tax=Seminavis robusta TaxID=568900 RepID=A0A9N8DLI2_9STRA|nr:expressed unknown protein [Seminavis robusta]|eukprot:Sro122_g059130.1 n/a (171) ;mRNA; f:27791-28480